jgi:plastocyanin
VRRGLAVAIGAAAVAVAPAVASTKPAPKPLTVKVEDDYFAPLKKTVKPGTKIVWKWSAYNGNTHDVKLKKGPKGVKKFQSEPAAAYFTYKKTLKVKGKYLIICTFHEDMTQTITVR